MSALWKSCSGLSQEKMYLGGIARYQDLIQRKKSKLQWPLIIILHSSKRREATARLFSPCCVRAKGPCPKEVPVPNAVLGLSHAHAACSSATTARCLAMKC